MSTGFSGILRVVVVLGAVNIAALSTVACGGASPTGGDADATEIARQAGIARAVAATLTAEARADGARDEIASPTSADATDASSATQLPPTAGPTAVPPTTAPTAAPPTTAPTTAPPSPSPTRELLAVLPVDGDDGNAKLRGSYEQNEGRNVLLPGFSASEVADPMVFRDRMVFRIEVFDTTDGRPHPDGYGIRNVVFRITDDNDDLVYEKTENNAGYCVFGGGEPNCLVWVFADRQWRWPNGTDILDGDYLATMTITPSHGEKATWRWRFQIAGARP